MSLLSVGLWWDSPSESPEQHRQCIRSSSKGSVGGAAKSLESDVKLEHILINKKAAEVSKIYLGRHVIYEFAYLSAGFI